MPGPIVPVGAPVAPQPATAPKGSSFGEHLKSARSPKMPMPAPAPKPPAAVQALKNIEVAQKRLDAMLKAAKSGKTFSPQELLALQAEAYRYSQTLEVAAKVVEHGAQSVKQAVNTQV